MPTKDNLGGIDSQTGIDTQVRQPENTITVLFTDVVVPTRAPEPNGDTCRLLKTHGHGELATSLIQQHGGKVLNALGGSPLAEFSKPGSALTAAVEIERSFLQLNGELPEDQRVEVRMGIHMGVSVQDGNDLFGGLVNVAARMAKRSAPAQILISREVYAATRNDHNFNCRRLSEDTVDQSAEQEDVYEIIWTDTEAYSNLRKQMPAPSRFPPRYKVLSQIGTGGTGIVYKVRDLETGEIVALKILKPHIAGDPKLQEALKREMCLARKITHKNVCRIHEFNRADGMAYTSMEFVEGESVAALLSHRGSLPLSEALGITRQICAGLREAHAQGIVHRDLKPANIMLDRNGQVKIMDFGIAHMMQSNNPMTGSIVGTPAYMAPEQAELKPLSSCTDIYALGLVIYEMVTGIPAFEGDSPIAVAVKQIREYPKRPREIAPQVPEAVEAVIMKCLQKDPAKRFQTVGQLESALWKSVKARRVSHWESAMNRWLARAEIEIHKYSQYIVGNAHETWNRGNQRVMANLLKEPEAMLGITGAVAAVALLALLGGWKPRTTNAQPIAIASQSTASTQKTPDHQAATFSTRDSLSPIASYAVDLYGDSTQGSGKTAPSDAELPNENAHSGPDTPHVSQKPALTPKRVATAGHFSIRKIDSGLLASTKLPEAEDSVQPKIVLSPAAQQNATDEAETNSPRPGKDSTPPIEQTATPSRSAPETEDIKSQPSYFEVGTFKDEILAGNEMDRLSQLGFQAVMLHKSLLWLQSYHVQVGPYTDPKEISAARDSLASLGFKAHLVN